MLKFSYLKTHSAVFKAVVILRGEKIRCGVECGEDHLQMLAIIVIASRWPCLLCYLLRTNGSFWLESYMANWNLHISGFNDLSKVRQLVNLTRMEVWFLDQSFLCSTLPLPPPVVTSHSLPASVFSLKIRARDLLLSKQILTCGHYERYICTWKLTFL